ncbi:hypothetical protein L226DRAFT_242918 [Lentinus tigrinus ALCF2SS1-7]|uniref:Yeast cell wall synthesis Kre9/Knh1-like N-terminal domain-containing protein n=1 Tax=Lentinus tigrinus ALCF2SS1-6 TaxID=1328759 RepID=A0A5C2SPJ6_9APHY|nr:hypothetical protein L227DRAFT_649529 [Lentinus tigrinus ALCF2SS1-6]RPD79170.1 hypothetical protein L226DRAFT_242918 [Lentinus tigrinus ALCF2SS1-7]
MFFTGTMRLLGTALLIVQLVSANIYPTSPYSRTIFTAGRMNTVEWVDDGTQPYVEEMGLVKIDLYVGEDYVVTLADLIDPGSLSQDVWISPSWRHNGSDYHIRFICQEPAVTIYSADFTITGMTNLYPLDGPSIDDYNATDPNVVYVTPMLTLVLPGSTVVSALKPTPSTISPSPSATAPSVSTYEDQGLDSRMRGHRLSDAGVASIRKRTTVDMEYLKFQSVFVFWPTLIGIAMAL